MTLKNDISLLSVSNASVIMGPELKIDNFILDLISRLRKQTSLKRLKLFLWDETVNRFYLEVDSDPRKVTVNPAVTDKAFYKAGVLRTAVFER
ncbi:MAG: hypothetical protein MUC52_02640, partial [Candidatus Omnitrophica bacterium]|nr:hypothetical protein [Candidatus Omnitrophota bacterium]